MSKKPASLTSDLLARKGEAEPSTIDPSARMTLSAGSGFSDSGGGQGGHPGDQGTNGRDSDIRPMPPEPEIIYTAEETGAGASNMRLIIIAVLGLIIVGGIFLAMTSNRQGGVAPVSPDVVAEAPAPQHDLSPSAPLTAAAPSAAATAEPATPTTSTPTTSEAPAPQGEISEAAPSEAASSEAVQAPAPVAEAAPEVAAPVEAAPAKAAPVEAAKPAAPAKAAVAPKAGGAYVVQLLALRDEASARAAWKKISAKHHSILSAHALDIEKADLGSKGVWYRVRAAGFASKAAAAKACASLKAAGQACIVKKR